MVARRQATPTAPMLLGALSKTLSSGPATLADQQQHPGCSPDAQVERVLARILHHVLVGSNASSLQGL